MAKNTSKFAIVTIGGSAGALTALQPIIAGLPSGLPAAVFVAIHVPPNSVSAMPHILSRAGSLFSTHAIDGAPIAPGSIVVAPPNRHLVIERGSMRVSETAKENGQRPSIDVLFRSAAKAYGDLVCGVLLSGTLDDGVAGMQTIRNAGGHAIAQNPDDAVFGDMPRNAIAAGAADTVAASDEIARVIVETVEQSIAHSSGQPTAPAHDERVEGTASVFTCPDCGGTLWELEEHGHLRFRCRIGHAYNVNTVLETQRSTLEDSLSAALRALYERADLLHRMARRADARGDKRSSKRFEDEAQGLGNDIAMIQRAVVEATAVSRSPAS